MVSVLGMTSSDPKVDKSQGTGHGANPTPQQGPEPAPADDGNAETEHFKKERVPSTNQDASKP
jgi:hypothetical protein